MGVELIAVSTARIKSERVRVMTAVSFSPKPERAALVFIISTAKLFRVDAISSLSSVLTADISPPRSVLIADILPETEMCGKYA